MQAPFRRFGEKCPGFGQTGEYGKEGASALGLALLLLCTKDYAGHIMNAYYQARIRHYENQKNQEGVFCNNRGYPQSQNRQKGQYQNQV